MVLILTGIAAFFCFYFGFDAWAADEVLVVVVEERGISLKVFFITSFEVDYGH